MRDAAAGSIACVAPAASAFAPQLRRLAFVVFAIALTLALYAALERRALHADGANYLMRLLELERFDLAEPARRTILVLQQAPALLAIRLGLVDAAGAGLVYCLTLELLPLALLALCYVALPRERKAYFYFPLAHYLAGTLSASASPVAEGIAGAAYFWLVFYLVLFRPLRGPSLALAFALALPLLYVHESMAGLSLPLAAAAGWRAWREGGARRLAFVVLAAWFVAMAVIHSYNIVVPHSTSNRAGLAAGLTGGWFLLGRHGEINLPAWLGLLALLVLNANTLAPAWSASLAWAFAGLAALGLVVAALLPATVAPGQQFASRVNPAALSLLLALGTLGSLWKPARESWWARRSTIAVLGALAAANLAWHTLEVHAWSRYLEIVRGVLAERRGLVQPSDIAAGLGARDRIAFRTMSWSWVFPETSLVLAPHGKVAAIIARGRPVPWRTWDPRDPAQIPKSRFWDPSAYRAAMEGPAR